jgi:hypothetical protein
MNTMWSDLHNLLAGSTSYSIRMRAQYLTKNAQLQHEMPAGPLGPLEYHIQGMTHGSVTLLPPTGWAAPDPNCKCNRAQGQIWIIPTDPPAAAPKVH